MRSKIEKITLIACGAIIGVLISLNLPVFADKAEKNNLPIDELRTFAEVFGILIGGLVLLKFTSLDFALKIGLESPITTIKIVLFYFGCFILSPLPFIHFYFK